MLWIVLSCLVNKFVACALLLTFHIFVSRWLHVILFRFPILLVGIPSHTNNRGLAEVLLYGGGRKKQAFCRVSLNDETW